MSSRRCFYLLGKLCWGLEYFLWIHIVESEMCIVHEATNNLLADVVQPPFSAEENIPICLAPHQILRFWLPLNRMGYDTCV